MRGRRIRILAAGAALCAGVAGACRGRQEERTVELHVGVTYYNQSDTFLNELIGCFKDELVKLEDSGFETALTVRDAAGAKRTQDDQVQELIDAGCNILCVNLVDRADPSEIIDLAREKDIPIIFFNREPVAEDMMQWEKLYYVGADAEQSGMMQGSLAADLIRCDEHVDRNQDGKIQYVVLEGEAGHQDAIIRTESAVDTLKSNGIVLEKLSCGIANWNRAQAQNRTMQLLSQHQGSIELVLANNDDMALGALDAYHKLNYTENALPVFFGIDGTDVGLEAVREADAILREEFAAAGLEDKVWQFFTVVPDFRSTGVRDGKRAFDWPVIIRAVNTVDAMTAAVPEIDWAVLKGITQRILAEVPGVCRVLYDLTPKPVGTIEWE